MSGGIDVEVVDSIGGTRLRSTASGGVRSRGDRHPGYHPRVRVAALTTELEALEAQVKALEAEVETLERAVEAKEKQRQQVIDNYETIVAARSETDRATDAESTTPAETAETGPLAAVASRVGRAVARLRRSNE